MGRQHGETSCIGWGGLGCASLFSCASGNGEGGTLRGEEEENLRGVHTIDGILVLDLYTLAF